MVFFDLIFYRSETNIDYLIVCWLPSPSSSLLLPLSPPSADLQTSRRVIWMRKWLNDLMACGVKAECCWVRVDANTRICCLVNQCGAFGCGESPIWRLEKMSSRFPPLYLLSASSHFLFNPSHPSFTSPLLLPSVIPSSTSNHPPPRRSPEVSVSRRKATFLLFISLFASHPVLFVFHCSCQNCQPALPLSSPSLPLPLTLHLPVFPPSALYHLLSAEGRNAARRPQSRHGGRKNTEWRIVTETQRWRCRDQERKEGWRKDRKSEIPGRKTERIRKILSEGEKARCTKRRDEGRKHEETWMM